jgi:hypothetical protein
MTEQLATVSIEYHTAGGESAGKVEWHVTAEQANSVDYDIRVALGQPDIIASHVPHPDWHEEPAGKGGYYDRSRPWNPR